MLSKNSHLSFLFGLLSTINIVFCYKTLPISWPEETERIVTDMEDVLNGVPVDFRYNESDTSSFPPKGGRLSVPGCPKSVDGYPWVYYGSPKKCYLAGERGPCKQDQKLFIEDGSPNGFCNCECFEGTKKNKNSKAEFCTSDSREHAFIQEEKKCYPLYDQGPCKSQEWLVKSTSNSECVTLCEPRKCPHGQIPYFDVGTDNENNHQKNFSCFSPISPFAGPVSIIPNDCESDGMKYSKLLKKCVKQFGFNFG